MFDLKAKKVVGTIAVLVLIFATFGSTSAQQSENDADGEAPKLSVGFVVYNAGTFRRGLERAVKILARTVDRLGENDEGFLITFAGSETLSVKTEVTSDKGELRDGIENIYVESGSSALWDSMFRSAEHILASVPDAPGTRRILIVVTDGDDRSNRSSFASAIKLIKEGSISVVVLGLADAQVSMKEIDKMAKETGGMKFVPLPTDDADVTAELIMAHLRGLK